MNKNKWYEVLRKHHEMYPEMGLMDYYKLMHQSVFGPKHLLSKPNKDQLVHYLERELNEMTFDLHHEVLEYIGNDFYRVYLHAITLNLISKEVLIDAFYQSMVMDLESDAELFKKMDESLHVLKAFLKDKELMQEEHAFDEFMTELKDKKYPAIHHSDSYNQKYQPHYRVIHKSYLEPLLKHHEPVRILVLSDIHLKSDQLLEVNRLKTAILCSLELKNGLDAICVVGDFTESGSDIEYAIFKDTIKTNLPKETKMIVSIGNHENLRSESDPHQKFEDSFLYQVDHTFDVKEYTVITLGTSKAETISHKQLAWLDEELRKATLKNPFKPIFFLHHYPAFHEVSYSVMGGQPVLYDILKKYPHVIHISGHTHPDLRDERILAIKPFVSYNNGSLSWQIYRDEAYVKKENRKATGQFSIIEVCGSDEVHIERYELNDETNQCSMIGAPFILHMPYSPLKD